MKLNRNNNEMDFKNHQDDKQILNKKIFAIIGLILTILAMFLILRDNTVSDETDEIETSTVNVEGYTNNHAVTEDFYDALIQEEIISADYITVNGEMDLPTAQGYALEYIDKKGIPINPEYDNCNFNGAHYLGLLTEGAYETFEEDFLKESQACNITTNNDIRVYLAYLDLDDANKIINNSMSGNFTQEELNEELKSISSPDVYISLLIRAPEPIIASQLINKEAYVPSYTEGDIVINGMEVEETLLTDINKELNYEFNGVYKYKITTNSVDADGNETQDVWEATVLTTSVECYLYNIELLTDDNIYMYQQAKTYK